MRLQNSHQTYQLPLLRFYLTILPFVFLTFSVHATVQDVSVACEDQVNFALDSEGNVVIGPESVTVISGNPAELDYITVTPNTFNCGDIGPTTVTVDWAIGGVADQCMVDILIEDKMTFPVACYADVIVSLDNDGVVELTSEMLLLEVMDNCNTSAVLSPSSVSCANVNTTVEVIVTVTDEGGNSNSCFSDVLVEDEMSPVAICLAGVVLDLAGGTSVAIIPADIDAGSFDNCSSVSLSLSQSVFTTEDVGSNTVLLTVDDPSGNSNVCFSTVELVSSVYCDSEGLSTADEYIKRVKFAGINNNSGDDGGYADYTGMIASVIAGNSYTLQLQPGFGGGKKVENWVAWIDWNQNNVFESSELVGSGASKKKINLSVAVPATALAGTTRMRISMQPGAFATACEIFANGEVEDYSIEVMPSGSPRVRLTDEDLPLMAGATLLEATGKKDVWSSLRLFPNPAKEMIRLEKTTFGKDSRIRIYNLLGKQLLAIGLGELSNQKEIDISGFPAGTYLLVLEDEKGREAIPFVKLN